MAGNSQCTWGSGAVSHCHIKNMKCTLQSMCSAPGHLFHASGFRCGEYISINGHQIYNLSTEISDQSVNRYVHIC